MCMLRPRGGGSRASRLCKGSDVQGPPVRFWGRGPWPEEGEAGESVLGKERWLRLGRLGLCPRDTLIIKCRT